MGNDFASKVQAGSRAESTHYSYKWCRVKVLIPLMSHHTLTNSSPTRHRDQMNYIRVFSKLSNTIDKPLCLIYNRSLEESVVPKDWRRTEVIPVHKKGPINLPCNYRPISLTSIACKIMESIIREYLMKHMIDNDLFAEQQHGFLPGRSCVTQLLDVLDDWFLNFDNNVPVDEIYLDMVKAFDTVPHRRLFTQLHSYGITEKIHSWIRAFLTDREQRTRINGSFSNWTKVLSGIPQGSVLGPILFLLYINCLPDSIKTKIRLFADDSKIWNAIRTTADCEQLQSDLTSLENWSSTWQLKFNQSKCKVLHIGRTPSQHQYHMHDSNGIRQPLEKSTAEKDLGVWVEDQLTFTTHTAKSAAKANCLLGLIRRTFKHLDKENLTLLTRQ